MEARNCKRRWRECIEEKGEKGNDIWRDRTKIQKDGKTKGKATRNDTVKEHIYKYMCKIHELRKERNRVLVVNELNSYKNEQFNKQGKYKSKQFRDIYLMSTIEGIEDFSLIPFLIGGVLGTP